MIAVDSSALIAILLEEPEELACSVAIIGADGAKISAPNFFEASMVAEARQGESGCRDLDRIATALGLDVVAFDSSHMEAARIAFRRYGKGRHRAALISATAAPMPSRKPSMCRCSSRAMTSR